MVTTNVRPITLAPQSEVVAQKRYYLKKQNGQATEDASSLFKRVATAIAAIEETYGVLNIESKLSEIEFYDIMSSLEFLPNSPTLMNAGTGQGTYSACFVFPLEDSM